MAGTFPGVANAQQCNSDGKPLIGGQLTVFQAASQALASCFQDIGLVIPAPNPMPLDASGRVPLFFVADGTYRVRLTDSTGVTTNGGFDILQMPSIGASASGGGGVAVDPTTVLSTGDIKFQLLQSVIAGWVRMNGRTVGSAASGASERANADTQPLYVYIWTNFADAICPVIGGRGVSALADFNANKQITLFDMCGRSPFGLDDMGGIAKNRLVNALFSQGNATTPGSVGGEAAHTLGTPEIPVHTHPAAAVVTDPGHTHPVPLNNAIGGALKEIARADATGVIASDALTGPSPTGISVAVTNSNTGGGQPHNTMPPFALGTWFWKL